MLRTNEDKLVMISVQGQISAPACQPRICFDGVVRVTPGTGGITYNVKVGDPAFGWAGDHVEPGVSTKNTDDRANSSMPDRAYRPTTSRVSISRVVSLLLASTRSYTCSM